MKLGNEMYKWAVDLFPVNRSITGKGVRETLSYIRSIIPELEIKSVNSGEKVFDWIVPDEWEIDEAFIENENGEKIIDFKQNNLHVVGYSEPIDKWVDLNELEKHLHSLPEQPDAIPYITSYYNKYWGFCLTDYQRKSLLDIKYHVVIKSKLFKGVLNYGEVLLPGDETKEIFLSTYICHPSMANNEISGPVVTTEIVKWLKNKKNKRYTYRIVFIPETIGSIAYLSINDNYINLKKNVIAGFQITCVGDNREVSFIPSRNGESLADHVAIYVLKNYIKNYKIYSYLDRGSDERQWCSPGIDLPIVSLIRSKYHEYPEYHTSLDDLKLISPEGLEGAFNNIIKCIEILELNYYYKNTTLCEPQLGRRNLYPKISTKKTKNIMKAMMNLLSYADGKLSLLQIVEIINEDFFVVSELAELLVKEQLMKIDNLRI
jgi:aminopeptidase-like protein